MGKRRLREDLTNACKYLEGQCYEDGVRFFSTMLNDKTKGNGHKKFHTNTRKNSPVRVKEC